MAQHPALTPGRTAVITGGADGIGLAVAGRLVALGLNVVIADRNAAQLAEAEAALRAKAPRGQAQVRAQVTDVGDLAQVERLRAFAYDTYGDVAFLMNNAGVGEPTTAIGGYDNWRAVLQTNLWGVINGVQTFSEAMIAQGTPAVIVNTGSKQGITTPPGNPAYNVSKAGIKVLTEALQHELRGTEGCQVSAHLLVPGFTYTGMMRRRIAEKPPAAWTSEQVADFLLEHLAAGDFYILCPDNDVTREMDEKRIDWAAHDLIDNRPPLSRWHPDYKAAFEAFMAGEDCSGEPLRLWRPTPTASSMRPPRSAGIDFQSPSPATER